MGIRSFLSPRNKKFLRAEENSIIKENELKLEENISSNNFSLEKQEFQTNPLDELKNASEAEKYKIKESNIKYKDLSKEIYYEKQQIIALKDKVLFKVKENNIKNKMQASISDEQREEILSSLSSNNYYNNVGKKEELDSRLDKSNFYTITKPKVETTNQLHDSLNEQNINTEQENNYNNLQNTTEETYENLSSLSNETKFYTYKDKSIDNQVESQKFNSEKYEKEQPANINNYNEEIVREEKINDNHQIFNEQKNYENEHQTNHDIPNNKEYSQTTIEDTIEYEKSIEEDVNYMRDDNSLKNEEFEKEETISYSSLDNNKIVDEDRPDEMVEQTTEVLLEEEIISKEPNTYEEELESDTNDYSLEKEELEKNEYHFNEDEVSSEKEISTKSSYNDNLEEEFYADDTEEYYNEEDNDEHTNESDFNDVEKTFSQEEDLSQEYVEENIYRGTNSSEEELKSIENKYENKFNNEEGLVKEISNTLETKLFDQETNDNSNIDYNQFNDDSKNGVNIIKNTEELKDKLISWPDNQTQELEEKIHSFKRVDFNNEKIWCNNYKLPIIKNIKLNLNKDSSTKNEAKNLFSKINRFFNDYRIKAKAVSYDFAQNYMVFNCEITEPNNSKLQSMEVEKNLKLSLNVYYLELNYVINDQNSFIIKISNSNKKLSVLLNHILDDFNVEKNSAQFLLGKDVFNNNIILDLNKNGNLLISSTNIYDKLLSLNTIVSSFLLKYKPSDLKLSIIDSKIHKFKPFANIPSLASSLINKKDKIEILFEKLNIEIDRRRAIMESYNLSSFDQLNKKLVENEKNKLPYIILLMVEIKEIISTMGFRDLNKIVKNAKNVGINIIAATSNANENMLSEELQKHFEQRVSFKLNDSNTSQKLLGLPGAEKLFGIGDMFISNKKENPLRGQCAFISDEEMQKIIVSSCSQCKTKYDFNL